MMGERTVAQEALFYEFSLERHVPADHLLRSIDRFVDLSSIREHLRPFYSEMGRPSIDPELMIRMLIIGYTHGIRSERRLCEEVHLNLAYRWFCRLGLDGAVPDHSTFSKNRHGRFRDSDLLRRLFEATVERCMAEGLVGGEGFAVDGSLIRADANRQRGQSELPSDALEPRRPRVSRRARRCCLRRRDTGHSKDHLADRSGSALDRAARRSCGVLLRDQLPDRSRARRHRRCRSDDRSSPGRGDGGQADDRAHRTIALDYGRRSSLQTPATGRPRCSAGWSTTKASSRMFRCSTNRPGPTAPSSRDEFRYDARRDIYSLPGGKPMRTTGTLVNDGATLIYRASKHDCVGCALKPRCCPNEPQRKVPRSIHEGARDLARDISNSDAWLISTAPAQEGRDAVRAPQAHPEAGSTTITRSLRGSRRVPPRSGRPEPPQDG